ncbi:YcnI family protein [Micromonospora sp. DSM 115977]|uniref:YcnI family protein n=1 Tax=Micromonospora reichwaldensis TaxID=3075516 RepID=A0ABU2X4T2_9ACTN|nr:YcnI family protein [Micromonospora sp. DSM 115977]MDT0532775.1 YcnI family protein [Micromonospora sp. DSM 115977]
MHGVRPESRRRAATVAALAAAGVLTWPAPAYAADVTTSPTQARQGGSVKLEFVVPDELPGARAERIEIRLPADAPIAEVYPMSVPGWAPRITSRRLDQPVAGIHSSRVDEVTSAVTWVRMPGTAPGPARLTLSMGPLPQTDRLAFEVLRTYADGTVVRWAGPTGARRAPALTLLPAAPGAAAGHGGHGAAPAAGAPVGGAGDVPATGARAAGGPAAGDAPAARARAAGVPAASDAPGGGGNADGMLAAGLLAGLGGGAAIGWLVSRWRRREPAEPVDLSVLREDPTARTDPDGPGPAAAGA